MTWLVNVFVVLGRGAAVLAAALWSAIRLAGVAGGALFGEGRLAERAAARVADATNQRLVLDVVRCFAPNLVLGRRFVAAYENTGTAVVTRDPDVREVLDHDEVFEVVYAAKMAKITGGGSFFLGMQNTPTYTQDVSNMRLAARREDVPETLAPFVASEAAALVGKAGGRIDVPQQLALPLLARMAGRYFGTPGPSEREMIDWTTSLFWYLFLDLAGEVEVEARAVAAGESLCAYLDGAIAERRASSVVHDDVLSRCLAMQAAGVPGLDDFAIRNNLVGLLIGAIPTISAACTQVLDVLLERPDALAGAQIAARAGDRERLGRYVFEAFRFSPLNPILYRIATDDYVVAKGTLRAKRIPKGAMVLAVNLSAMFDPWTVPAPDEFRVDRPWSTYILFGYGLHTCFGETINRTVMPGILEPLLARSGLRRAEGASGRLQREGTPFPVHMEVGFDAA